MDGHSMGNLLIVTLWELLHDHVDGLDGVLQKVMAVVKMRGSDHRKELRAYEVGEHGVLIGKALTEYTGIITGVARHRDDLGRRPDQASSS